MPSSENIHHLTLEYACNRYAFCQYVIGNHSNFKSQTIKHEVIHNRSGTQYEELLNILEEYVKSSIKPIWDVAINVDVEHSNLLFPTGLNQRTIVVHIKIDADVYNLFKLKHSKFHQQLKSTQ